MRRVISLRVTEKQLEILRTAEELIQKPRAEILAKLIENDLASNLNKLWTAGARPKPFSPPPQRERRRKAAHGEENNPS